MAAFVILERLLIVPVGTMGPFWPGDIINGPCGSCEYFLAWGLMVPMGIMGHFGPRIALSRLYGSCVLCPKLRVPRARASHLLRFIVLVSFSDTLLVVPILDIFVRKGY